MDKVEKLEQRVRVLGEALAAIKRSGSSKMPLREGLTPAEWGLAQGRWEAACTADKALRTLAHTEQEQEQEQEEV